MLVKPPRNGRPPSGHQHRCCMAVVSSCREMLVKSRNERNPRSQLPTRYGGDSGKTAGAKPEEGGDDVKSSWSLRLGLHTCYNDRYRGLRARESKPIP